MRQFSVRGLAVALVASMVGLVAAATTTTTVVQTTAKLVPVAGKTALGRVPSTATATAVGQIVTLTKNGTTFKSVKKFSVSVKGLTELPDDTPLNFVLNKTTTLGAPYSTSVINGNASFALDDSTVKHKLPFLAPKVQSGDELQVYAAGVLVLVGFFGPSTTTTK